MHRQQRRQHILQGQPVLTKAQLLPHPQPSPQQTRWLPKHIAARMLHHHQLCQNRLHPSPTASEPTYQLRSLAPRQQHQQCLRTQALGSGRCSPASPSRRQWSSQQQCQSQLADPKGRMWPVHQQRSPAGQRALSQSQLRLRPPLSLQRICDAMALLTAQRGSSVQHPAMPPQLPTLR